MNKTPGFSDDQIDAMLAGDCTGTPGADALAGDLASFRDALSTAPTGRAQWVHLAAMRQAANEEVLLSRRRTRRFATTMAAILGTFGFLGVTGGLAAADSLPGPVQSGVEAVARSVGLEVGGNDPSGPVPRDRPATTRDGDAPVVTAPGQSGTAPGQTGSTPGQSGSAPGQTGTAPGQTGSTPGQSGSAPGQTGTTPGQTGSTPGQSGTTPGQTGSTPGQSGTAPGQSGTAPGQTGSTPGQSGSAPGQPGTTPGQPGSAPGRSGTAPGHSGTAPGQSSTAPASTGSQGDA